MTQTLENKKWVERKWWQFGVYRKKHTYKLMTRPFSLEGNRCCIPPSYSGAQRLNIYDSWGSMLMVSKEATPIPR